MAGKEKVTAIWYVSSFQKKDQLVDAIGVVEKQELTDEDGNKRYIDYLRWYEDPQRVFYVTSPAWRNHQYKKEFEDISLCDKYICKDSELELRVSAALGYYSKFKRPMRMLAESLTYM